jgi:zona occludens toxin (predicted ATPase)
VKILEVNMKKKSILAIVLVALIVAACSSSAPTTQPAQSDTTSNAAAAATTTTGAQDQAAAGNTTTTDSSAQATVSFSKDVWPIFEQYVVKAHGGKGGVFLENYNDIMNYVVPGDPTNSMLYKALIGDGVQRMPPPPEAPLPDAMIQTIHDWIAQGALNN